MKFDETLIEEMANAWLVDVHREDYDDPTATTSEEDELFNQCVLEFHNRTALGLAVLMHIWKEGETDRDRSSVRTWIGEYFIGISYPVPREAWDAFTSEPLVQSLVLQWFGARLKHTDFPPVLAALLVEKLEQAYPGTGEPLWQGRLSADELIADAMLDSAPEISDRALEDLIELEPIDHSRSQALRLRPLLGLVSAQRSLELLSVIERHLAPRELTLDVIREIEQDVEDWPFANALIDELDRLLTSPQ